MSQCGTPWLNGTGTPEHPREGPPEHPKGAPPGASRGGTPQANQGQISLHVLGRPPGSLGQGWAPLSPRPWVLAVGPACRAAAPQPLCSAWVCLSPCPGAGLKMLPDP